MLYQVQHDRPDVMVARNDVLPDLKACLKNRLIGSGVEFSYDTNRQVQATTKHNQTD